MTTTTNDLQGLRETASKALIAVLWLHVPVSAILGLARGADWMVPTVAMTLFATASTVSWRTSGSELTTRLIVAVALMADVSLLVYQMAGHPWLYGPLLVLAMVSVVYAYLRTTAAWVPKPVLPRQAEPQQHASAVKPL